jgi:hypothetical protein
VEPATDSTGELRDELVPNDSNSYGNSVGKLKPSAKPALTPLLLRFSLSMSGSSLVRNCEGNHTLGSPTASPMQSPKKYKKEREREREMGLVVVMENEMGMRKLLVGEDLIMTQPSLLGLQAEGPNKRKKSKRKRRGSVCV